MDNGGGDPYPQNVDNFKPFPKSMCVSDRKNQGLYECEMIKKILQMLNLRK